jgi:ABC-type antimicrobial peptide transport system permease subunit
LNFFVTLELSLIEGRVFTRDDYGTAPPVAVVNEAFARTFLQGDSALGRLVRTNSPDAEIVGVVADVKHASLREPASPPIMYLPLDARYRFFWLDSDNLFVRYAGSPEMLIPAIRALATEADPLATIRLRTQRSELERVYSSERRLAILSALFGALALLISMIGLFGLMSWVVARRTRELGIRMALGAQPGRIRLSVLGESWILLVTGILLGIPVALSTTRIVGSMLFGLAPNDPVTIIGAACLMLIVGTVASYLPARRASTTDPLVALRYE